MKKILCAGPVLAMLLALAGCCANDICVCNDALADALFFRFELGGTTGFRPSQIDTFWIVRITYPAANAPVGTMIVKDSVLRVLPLTILANGDTTIATDLNSIVINNAAPFASAGSSTKLNAYDYRINTYQTILQNNTRTIRRNSFLINNITLTGKNDATGCCTCYENTGKQFNLSGQFYVGKTLVGILPTLPKPVTAPVDAPTITSLTKR